MPHFTALDPELVSARRKQLDAFYQSVESVLVGQIALIDRMVIGLLTDGHILLEGLPGLAKTLSVRLVAQALQMQFKRIQFTPDLLPADIIGTQIYQPKTGEFSIKKGPIFANLILADEINRAPAKVQSALLEAMQERQVTIGDSTFPLPAPFLVLATQNPIDQEGTYSLPEAQIDRFMLKVILDYPKKDEELEILNRMGTLAPNLNIEPVLTAAELEDLRSTVDQIYIDGKLKQYIVDIVRATRHPADYGLSLSSYILHGASPRATIALCRGVKAIAFLHGRSFVLPEDIKAIAPDVLRHRIILSYEAEAENFTSANLLQLILNHLAVP